MATRTWKIYGLNGHRQKHSFSPSYVYDFTKGDNIRVIEVENFDKTGTNDYSLVKITRNTMEECLDELDGQIYDGIFENMKVGKVIEVIA